MRFERGFGAMYTDSSFFCHVRIEKSKRPLGFMLCICAYAISGGLLFAMKFGDGCASNWYEWWMCVDCFLGMKNVEVVNIHNCKWP